MTTLHLLLTGLLLSIDSFIVSLAIGPLIAARKQKWILGGLFGGWDGGAILMGAALGHGLWLCDLTQKIVPLYALLLGIYCLAAAGWNKFRANPRFIYGLPVVMSFDNLAWGIGQPLTATVAGQALGFGLISYLAAMTGLLFWNVIRLPDVRIKERLAGYGLLLCGVAQFFI